MKFELAPIEGITTFLYRNAVAHYYGGIDKYYTPFLSLHRDKEFNFKELKELLPEHNKGLLVVPQVLTNSAADFKKAARRLAEFGYQEVNLNFGCPSGTVTAKGKGAGMLEDVKRLDAFLAEIFEDAPIAVSIKTRLGMYAADEFAPLLSVYEKYPLKELIVHARVRQDFYEGSPDWESFGGALSQSRFPVCYNGDVFSQKDYDALRRRFPALSGVMLGRGMVMRPWLAAQLSGVDVPALPGIDGEAAAKRRLRAFHDEIYHGYLEIQYGERNTLFRMKELWTYMIQAFSQADGYAKKLRKAKTCAAYESVISQLFAEGKLTEL